MQQNDAVIEFLGSGAFGIGKKRSMIFGPLHQAGPFPDEETLEAAAKESSSGIGLADLGHMVRARARHCCRPLSQSC